ncbi:MAG: hypothetical protein ACI4S4_06550, partial [Candidatus Ornithospirochaeta sp.]
VVYSVDFTAYVEVINENDDEEESKKYLYQKMEDIISLLKDKLRGEISMGEVAFRTSSFKDKNEFLTDVVGRSSLAMMDDTDFTSSLSSLFFPDEDNELTGMHISSRVPYFTGIDEDGEPFVLGAVVGEGNTEEDLMGILDHAEEVYPRGNVYMLKMTEDGEIGEWEEVTDLDEDFSLYYRSINLRSIDPDDDGFFAADTLLCCIDDDYESQLEDEE